MAHISLIDVPTDTYGEVSTLTKPLLDRLNHTSMSRSTFTALSTLLVWALARLEDVEKDLNAHEVHTGIVIAPEDFIPVQKPVAEEPKAAPEDNTPTEDENAPLPAITAAEEAEEAATAAEIAQAEAEVASKVEVETPVEAEVPKTTKRVAKPV